MAAVAKRLAFHPPQIKDTIPPFIPVITGMESVTGDAGNPALGIERHVGRHGHGGNYSYGMCKPFLSPVIALMA